MASIFTATVSTSPRAWKVSPNRAPYSSQEVSMNSSATNSPRLRRRRRASGQERRETRASIPSAHGRRRRGDANETDTRSREKICAAGRVLDCRVCDYRRNGRHRAASLLAPAGSVRVHTLCADSRAYLARRTIHSRAALQQPKWRSAGGIFQRRNYLRHYHRSLQVARLVRNRPRFLVLLQGQANPGPGGEPRTGSEVRFGGWSAEGGRPTAGHGPVSGCDQRRGPMG